VRALIVADGVAPSRRRLDATWPGWSSDVGLVVAADGGARVARSLGLEPDLVVGDGDSLGAEGIEELRARGVEIRLARADKDESDTELAILTAIEAGATAITLVAAFGGRLDHALANIWLLALPALGDRPMELLDDNTRVTLIAAPRGVPVRRVLPGGRPGDVVSLLPLDTTVVGITTERLRYPLRNETLLVGPSRGLSNVRLEADAAVTVRLGRLLVVETPALLATLGR
jgi:thiamine pyrophosphokinase